MDPTSQQIKRTGSGHAPPTVAWSVGTLVLAACSAVIGILARALWSRAWYVPGGVLALVVALLPVAAWLYAAASAGAILRRIRHATGGVRAVLGVALLFDAVALLALVVVGIDFLRP